MLCRDRETHQLSESNARKPSVCDERSRLPLTLSLFAQVDEATFQRLISRYLKISRPNLMRVSVLDGHRLPTGGLRRNPCDFGTRKAFLRLRG